MIKNVVLFLSVVIIDFIHSESCTRSCDCFNENAGDVHVENGEQSCCSGTCKLKCDSSSQCDDQYDRYKGGECFTKDEHPCPSSSNNQDTNCGNQVDGTTSRNVNGECVRCNSGSFAADNSMNCAVCTAVVGALSTATYTCTNAFDSRVSACAASSTTKKTVGASDAADTCTTACAPGTWDNANVCSSGSDSSGSGATYVVGQRVQGNWLDRGTWYAGKVEAANSDNTYDIKYDDDDFEASVPASRLRTETSSSDSSSTGCADGCHSSYLADGTCDSSCNNAACNYDNGDCKTSPSGTSPSGSTSSSYCVASSSSSSSSSSSGDGASNSNSDSECVCNGKKNSNDEGGSDCATIYDGSNYPDDSGKAFCYVDEDKCSDAHSSSVMTGSEWSVTPCQSNSLSSSSSKKSDGSSCSYNSDCSSGTCSSSDSESSCDITADCNKDELEKMMECMEDIDLNAIADSSTSEEMCDTLVEALNCYASCICRKACFQDQIKLTKETCDTNACSSLGAGDSKSFDGLVLILILLVHLTFG